MKLIPRSIAARLKGVPAAVRLHAWWRRRRYERRVARFLAVRDGRADRFPDGLVYEATMRCNLRCEFCYVGELLNSGEWRQELSLDVLTRALPERDGLQVSLTGGEIFVRKDIGEILRLFRDKGYVCGYLTTNGTMIDEPRARMLADLARTGFLKHVSVSIDGPAPLHDEARGVAGTYERTAAGLRRLQEAANAASAPLNVSINTTVSRQSLPALEKMVEVARDLGVDALGVNHLMYATGDEVDETVATIGAADRSIISTFVTSDPGVSASEVSEKVRNLATACRQHGMRFDVRPKVHAGNADAYYGPGRPVAGRCLYPFLHARVGFNGKVYFCPFIRVEMGDLKESPLEEIWNNDRYVQMRRRLVEHGMFPVCRRCCKVELEREC
jgi:MoaA/NifB/PqqE/SkfB family radical SAM enzyme